MSGTERFDRVAKYMHFNRGAIRATSKVATSILATSKLVTSKLVNNCSAGEMFP